jgi:hypothetical protein
MNYENQKEKIKNLPFIQALKEFKKWGNTIELVGGAVIDILEDRTPKDYDFTGININDLPKLSELGFVFSHDSKTAFSFTFEDYSIQFLKGIKSEFDYTISTSSYNVSNESLIIDEISFAKKILIPNAFTYEKKHKSINALKRVLHYNKKGYTLPDETYISLLNNISTKGGINS